MCLYVRVHVHEIVLIAEVFLGVQRLGCYTITNSIGQLQKIHWGAQEEYWRRSC